MCRARRTGSAPVWRQKREPIQCVKNAPSHGLTGLGAIKPIAENAPLSRRVPGRRRPAGWPENGTKKAARRRPCWRADTVLFHYNKLVVRGAGLEPARPCGRQDLNLVRLPISPPARFGFAAKGVDSRACPGPVCGRETRRPARHGLGVAHAFFESQFRVPKTALSHGFRGFAAIKTGAKSEKARKARAAKARAAAAKRSRAKQPACCPAKRLPRPIHVFRPCRQMASRFLVSQGVCKARKGQKRPHSLQKQEQIQGSENASIARFDGLCRYQIRSEIRRVAGWRLLARPSRGTTPRTWRAGPAGSAPWRR